MNKYNELFIKYDRNVAAGMGLTIASGIITILALIILGIMFGFEQAKSIASTGVFGILGGILITIINSKLQDAVYEEYISTKEKQLCLHSPSSEEPSGSCIVKLS